MEWQQRHDFCFTVTCYLVNLIIDHPPILNSGLLIVIDVCSKNSETSELWSKDDQGAAQQIWCCHKKTRGESHQGTVQAREKNWVLLGRWWKLSQLLDTTRKTWFTAKRHPRRWVSLQFPFFLKLFFHHLSIIIIIAIILSLLVVIKMYWWIVAIWISNVWL